MFNNDDEAERREFRARERVRVLMGHIHGGVGHASHPSDGDGQNRWECATSSNERSRSLETSATTAAAAIVTHPQDGVTSSDIKIKVPKKSSWLDSLQMDPKLYWPRKYRYTVEPLPGALSPLSKKQRDQYEDNGYLLMRGLIPSVKMARLLEINSKLSPSLNVGGPGATPQSITYEKEELSQFARIREVKRFVECFCGNKYSSSSIGKVVSFPSQSNPLEVDELAASQDHHQLDQGSDPLHQDLFFLPMRPADRIVSVLIATQPLTRLSGCVQLVPATHRKGHIENVFSDWETGAGRKMIYEPLIDVNNLLRTAGDQVKILEIQPGDVLYYHPLLVHGLTSNLLDAMPSLVGVTVHYASASCETVEILGGLPEGMGGGIPPGLVDMSLNSDFMAESLRNSRMETAVKWN